MECYLNQSGGGASLNFDVRDFRTEAELLASAGKENRIGVVASVPMTGWRFAANQPEDLQEGEVWISVGTASAVEFNALKKNSIQIYPLFAKQYVGGLLESNIAKIYQSGKWVDWIPEGVLYRSGMPYATTIEATNYINSGSFSGVTPSLTDNSDYLTLEIAGSGAIGWTIFSKSAVDLSKFTKAVATVKRNNTVSGFSVLLGVTDTKKAGYSVIAEKDSQASASQQTFELDLSSVNVNGYPFISLKRTSSVTSKCTVDLFDWHLE